jgi:hypothetical protein
VQGNCKICTFSIARKGEKLESNNSTNAIQIQQKSPSEPRESRTVSANTRVLVADTTTDTVSPVQSVETETSGNLTCINNTYGEGDERNKYITYAANKLIENGLVDGYYNYLDFLATWQHESDWQINALNTANSNGTSDHGLCQLNSKWHGKYILSDPVAMANPYAQLDYCVAVAVDAKNKGTMPWSAWKNGSKDKHINKFECTS